jgi:ribosomal protein L3
MGMLARWDGEGAIGVVERWGVEGVATATGRRRAGVDVATGWRRRRSVWGRRESWHQHHALPPVRNLVLVSRLSGFNEMQSRF